MDSASLRVKVETLSAPSHPSAGYLVTIPDGGALSRNPAATVVDANGTPLKHGVLWHDPGRGMALVFEPPPEGQQEVYVYFRPGGISAWQPSSGLTPSVLAFCRSGAQTMIEAQRMARSFPPGKDVYFERPSVMGMGALPQGISGSFADYILGYVETKDPGRTWIAGMSGGPCSVQVDGHEIKSEKPSSKVAGAGEWFELDPGLHRVEIFHATPSATDRGYAWVWWKTPNMPAGDLQASWAARPIRENECARSGAAVAREASARGGLPTAMFFASPVGYVLFTEKPLILYKLTAVPAEEAEGAPSYTWTAGKQAPFDGPAETFYLFEQGRDTEVGLTVTADKKKPGATQTVFTHCPGDLNSNLNDAKTQDQYREALRNLFKSCPAGKSPEGWGADLRSLLVQLIEPGKTDALLRDLFAHHWSLVRSGLKPQDRRSVEDLCLADLTRSNATEAVKWIETNEGQENDFSRQLHWRIKRAELLMYALGKFEEAKRILNTVVRTSGEPVLRAQVRLGDAALLAGDYNEALRLYGEAQNTANRRRPAKAEPAAAKSGAGKVAAWKSVAVRGTAASETVRQLIRDGELAEARDALDKWELEFPMSKVSGDFVVVESQYLLKLGDAARAARELEAYTRAVDTTSYLSEAMELALKAMVQAKLPPERIQEYVAEIKKRLPLDPLLDRLGEITSPNSKP